MAHQSVEKSLEILAPASKVWKMFTDKEFTKQMGGEYVSDWKVGSTLHWKGMDGTILTKCIILKIEPEKLLQHNLFFSPNSSDVMATLTYELQENNGHTTINIREDFANPITDQEYVDSGEGWEVALGAVKELMEK